MKLQKAGFTLLLLIIGLGLSSCSDDYYTKRASLDITPDERVTKTDLYGDFSFYYDIYDTDIANVDVRREAIVGSRLYTSELWIESRYIRRGDIADLSFEADGREYAVSLQAYDSGAFYINESDYDYALFMDQLVKQVIRYKTVRLYIDGRLRNFLDTYFLMTIKNDIEVEIRD